MRRVPGIAWVALLVAAFLIAALAGIVRRERTGEQLRAQHQATVAAERVVVVAETLYVHDTVPLREARAIYRTLRDSALRHVADTLVREAFAAGDRALLLDSTAIASAGRALEAHRVYEGALRAELAIAPRQRPSRFQLATIGAMDFTTNVPVVALEGTIRVTEHWTLLARAEQRLTLGERVHQQLGVRYTF